MQTRAACCTLLTTLIGVTSVAAESGGVSPDGDPLLEQRVVPAAQLARFTFGRGGGSLLRADPNSVSVSNVATGQDPEGDAPSTVRFTPDGAQIVIAHRDSRALTVWDTSTQTFVRQIPVSGQPLDVAISADGTRAVTANLDNDTVSIVNLTTGSELTTVAVGDVPGRVIITPDGTKAIVANFTDSTLSVVDIASATELRQIPGPSIGATLSFAPENGRVQVRFGDFVAADNSTVVFPNRFDDEILFIDVDTGVVTAIPSNEDPADVDITPDGSVAVVSHASFTAGQQAVTVLDVAGQSIMKVIPMPSRPTGPIAINHAGTRAAVAVQNAARVVNLTTDAVSAELNTASLNDLITTADGDHAVGVGFFGPLISLDSQSIVANMNFVVSAAIGDVAPVGTRAAMASTTFGEDLLTFNTDPAAAALESVQLSGPAPEGDAPRTVAVTQDGGMAAVVHILSDTVTFVDTATNTVLGFGQVGMRPSGVAFTPDGSNLVVANLDDSFASVIDTSTFMTTNVAISRRGSQVEVSPDGQFAYVPVVASGDGVWRINLNTLAVDGPKLPAGNMGSVGYSNFQASGIALSSDGALLAVAGSFDNVVTLIDAVNWQVLTNVPTGAFPTFVWFSPDDSLIFVSLRNDDQVQVIDAATHSMIGTFASGADPLEVRATADNGTAYVHNWGDMTVTVHRVFDPNNAGVVDGAVLDTIPLPNRAMGVFLDETRNCLLAASGTGSTTFGGAIGWEQTESGEISVFDLSTNALLQQVPTGLASSAAAFSADHSVGAIVSPALDGGVAIVRVAAACPGDLDGDQDVDLDDLTLLLQNFGSGAGGDIDGDGDTDLDDLTLLLQNFGAVCI